MNTCKLCLDRSADKKNTHYLTDNIIRICLNENGSNVRGKGLMFDISSGKSSIEMKFQQHTSQKAIEETLGREPNEEEIAEAKKIEFSVDNVFCSPCEDIFTAIEEQFTNNILPKLRGQDFTGMTEISFNESIIIRKFFLLQVWRTSICDPGYQISHSLQGRIREIIISPDIDSKKVLSIPLNITYTNTLGDDNEYTKNSVGIGSVGKNQIIIFNDFLIQVFENWEDVKYVDFLGFNDKETFEHFTNQNESDFIIKVIDNEGRLKIWGDYAIEKSKEQLWFYRKAFIEEYLERKGYSPPIHLVNSFEREIINGNMVNDESRYSMERFLKLKAHYLNV